ncbi:acyltransferase [Oceanomicrobium pacificus]|uniref:Acyltransferase family protein n=1 Tax=Oceanomicrobium pacificus TaxID=2692916 RepID=A0A6B0TTS1_9RHOB|nr:acyltransferase [Oceanomicrobium pacificus]MXU64632.1 acyltransferase family protein [Oceanomicrobium pacificus]
MPKPGHIPDTDPRRGATAVPDSLMAAGAAGVAPDAPPATAQGRMVWLDVLRLMAGISMVGLHASSDFAGQPFPDYPPDERIVPVLFRSLVYIARTELFLVISLFLVTLALDRRPRPYRVMVGEQARRLLVPFAFWVLFYAFYRLIKADAFGYADAIRAQLADPWSWLGYVLLGDVQYHMHFLPTLFGLMLMVPLYRVAVRMPAVGLAILLCLFAKREIEIWLWSSLADAPYFDYLLRFVKILTYGGYGLVGASFYGIIRRGYTPDAARDWARLALFAGLLLYGLKLVYSARVVAAGDWQYGYAPAYWADFLMPAVLFGGVMALSWKSWPPILHRLAPYSFGIYLVHPAFMDLVEIRIAGLDLTPTAQVGAKFFGALACTSIAVAIIARVPPLAWTIGLGPLKFWPSPATIKPDRNRLSEPAPRQAE